MRTFHLLIVFFLTVWVGHAAEIVAWKVPLTNFVENGLQTKGITRCKVAPEASPFFKAGDELWDLTSIPGHTRPVENDAVIFQEGEQSADSAKVSQDRRIETDPPLEWVVWNASSGRLVAKADWNGIWQLNQFLTPNQIPKQIRITAEVFEVPNDGTPLSNNAVSVMKVSWVTSSGNEFDATEQSGSSTIQVKGAVVTDESLSYVDLKIDLECDVKDHQRMKFTTAFRSLSDDAIWVARDFDGNRGLDLRISSRIELIDETPVREILMIQKDVEKSAPVVVDKRDSERHSLGEAGWLITLWLDPIHFESFWPSKPDDGKEVDPFAEPPEPNFSPFPKFRRFAVVDVPTELKLWFKAPVWDLRESMRSLGLILHNGFDFVGYEPRRQTLFMFSKNLTELDKFESLFTTSCNLTPKILIASFDGISQVRLAAKSGLRSRLERFIKDQKVNRSFEMEPTICESDDLISIRCDYHDASNVDRKQEVVTAITVRDGQPVELLSNGEKKPLHLKVDIVRGRHQ